LPVHFSTTCYTQGLTMKIIRNYKVSAVYDSGFEVNAVVACENIEDAFALSGFDEDDYSEQRASYIGVSTYTEPALICCESV